jgi:hypothetical protein
MSREATFMTQGSVSSSRRLGSVKSKKLIFRRTVKMKNLMLGLAVAALCGSAVGATAGTVVTSTKTVGYRNTATVNGYKLVTPTFVNTDSEALPITAVTVSGEGTVTLKIFGSNGAFGDAYTWQAASEANNQTAGWYNGETLCTKTFKKGEGFVTSASADTAKVRIAGLVPSGSVSYSLPAGYSIIGNPFNTGVSIQKFKLADVGGMYNASLQSIGANGQTGEMYYWVSDAIAGEDKGGWYSTKLERLADATNTVQPGTTYLLYTVGAATLTIE